MSTINIIYQSSTDGSYLWNGSAFDKLENEDQESLFYSGKSLVKNTLYQELEKVMTALARDFPSDKRPEVKYVEVPVTVN
jgi:hypothetical protein